jgi:glycosyltransferase involved in cell wall biosynthesis
MEKVSVIIPTFNRFKYLLNTIESVKNQTYKNLEIIVINDCSSQKEYYEYNWQENGVIIIHLEENSKQKFGFACAGYVRNQGIEISSGEYIAFCDDDDSWFPKKIELQMNAMKETGCKMSSTDGLIGNGVYFKDKKYKVYNKEHYYSTLQNIYRSKGSNLLDNGFPKIWNLDFLKIHNCVIASSAVVSKDILVNYNCIQNEPNGTGDDYRIWLRALEHTDCVYVDDVCFYYDAGHGDGNLY